MIDEVLAFWFGEPATTTEAYGQKMRRWFQGGAALDAEIRAKFAVVVEEALTGAIDWSDTPRGRLAQIIVLDQFPRSIYRNQPRSFAGDARAQALVLDGFDRGDDRQLSIEQRQFFMMPLIHAEDLALQERAVTEMDRIVADAAPFQRPMLAMGIEQSRKYRDVIANFGRFPHRNKVLGRTSTPDEEAFLVDWAAKMAPAGAKDL